MSVFRKSSSAKAKSTFPRFVGPIVVGVLAATMLSSCASDPALDAGAADELQTAVVQIAELAASNDITGAMASLDAMEAKLAEKTAAGSVTEARSAEVQATIVLVRADLQAMLDATAPAAPVETPSTTPQPEETSEEEPSEDEDAEDSEDSEESEEPAVPTPAESTSDSGDSGGPGEDLPGDSSSNNGNKGPGNGNNGTPPGQEKKTKE